MKHSLPSWNFGTTSWIFGWVPPCRYWHWMVWCRRYKVINRYLTDCFQERRKAEDICFRLVAFRNTLSKHRSENHTYFISNEQAFAWFCFWKRHAKTWGIYGGISPVYFHGHPTHHFTGCIFRTLFLTNKLVLGFGMSFPKAKPSTSLFVRNRVRIICRAMLR